jgi:hypothetical protein
MATGPVAIAAGREALSPLLTWRLQAGTFLEKYDGGPRIEAGRATVRFRFFSGRPWGWLVVVLRCEADRTAELGAAF